MSRVGNQAIAVPDKVKVSIADNHVAVEGPKASWRWTCPGAPVCRRRKTP